MQWLLAITLSQKPREMGTKGISYVQKGCLKEVRVEFCLLLGYLFESLIDDLSLHFLISGSGK